MPTVRPWRWVAFGALAVVGVAGAITTVLVRPADSAFLFRQEAPTTVHADRLEELVKRPDEPVPASPTRAVKARCRAFGHGELRNPWSCRVRYASGTTFTYRIRIEPGGSYKGSDATGEHVVSGCCVGE